MNQKEKIEMLLQLQDSKVSPLMRFSSAAFYQLHQTKKSLERGSDGAADFDNCISSVIESLENIAKISQETLALLKNNG